MVKYPHIYSNFKQMADIPEEEWLHLEEHLTSQTFKKNDHIIRAGDKTDKFYLIQSGLTRSYYIDNEGKEYNKIFLSDNEIASAYVEILKDIPARLNIQALEKTETVCFSYSVIQELYTRHDCWNQVGRKIAENFFILKEQREYEFLLLDAKDRYQSFLIDYGHLKDRIPQYHIAGYLGITPVSLSRIINQNS